MCHKEPFLNSYLKYKILIRKCEVEYIREINNLYYKPYCKNHFYNLKKKLNVFQAEEVRAPVKEEIKTVSAKKKKVKSLKFLSVIKKKNLI